MARGVMRYESAEACRVGQTSDCDVKCRITFSFQWKFHVYRPRHRLENHYDDFVV